MELNGRKFLENPCLYKSVTVISRIFQKKICWLHFAAGKCKKKKKSVTLDNLQIISSASWITRLFHVGEAGGVGLHILTQKQNIG